MTIDKQKVDQIITIFRNKYPDLITFSNPRFMKDEVDYKRSTIAKARDLLSNPALARDCVV